MKKSVFMWVVIVLILIGIAGLVWIYFDNQPSPLYNDVSPTPPSGEVVLYPSLNASSSLNFVIAENGFSLYRYTKDTTNTSNCSGQCAVVWPPYVVSSSVGLNVDPGVKGKLGTITRSDGSIQVTYNGMPLYYYSKDTDSTDIKGQGFGGLWFLVAP